MGDGNGLLVTLGNIVARERKTRRIEMVKALINGFLLAHREGHLAKEEITTIGVDLVEGAPEFEAIEHIGFNARTKEQSEGLTCKELWSQGQRPIGKAQAIEDHPFDRFAWGDRLLVVRLETSVNHAHQS